MLLKSIKIGDFSSRFLWNFVGIAGNNRLFERIRKIFRNQQNLKKIRLNFANFDTKFWQLQQQQKIVVEQQLKTDRVAHV